MSDDRVKSAEAEVQKLLDARIIREVRYPVWVANVVRVPKKNGKMRMCINFIELNKECPKDPYPLPRIDIFIDQVWLRREDEVEIGFTTPFRVFCFVRMPRAFVMLSLPSII
jgi:hypothetical protein